jgi:hypothetical protein
MNEVTYSEVNGYRIPDLALPDEPETELGKYGLMRRSYLKEHRKGLFSRLLMNGGLNAHLSEIDRTARERMTLMVPQLAAERGLTEELKARDQMKWVGMMNAIRHSCEETILQDLIYS